MDQSKQLFVYCIIIIIPVYLSQVSDVRGPAPGRINSMRLLWNAKETLDFYSFVIEEVGLTIFSVKAATDRAEANSEANQWRIFLCRSHSLDVLREPFKDYIDSEGVRLAFLTIFV